MHRNKEEKEVIKSVEYEIRRKIPWAKKIKIHVTREGRGIYTSSIVVHFRKKKLFIRKATEGIYDSLFEAKEALMSEIERIKSKCNRYSFVA